MTPTLRPWWRRLAIAAGLGTAGAGSAAACASEVLLDDARGDGSDEDGSADGSGGRGGSFGTSDGDVASGARATVATGAGGAASSGELAATTGGSFTTGVAASSSTGFPAPCGCDAPTPVQPGGQELGLALCEAGVLARREAIACPVLQDEGCEGCVAGDCAALPGSYCGLTPRGICSCIAGCSVDADCGDGRLCLCGDDRGRCVEASCRTPSDCAGAPCLGGVRCSGENIYFACSLPDDGCCTAAECAEGLDCVGFAGQPRTCIDDFCGKVGRPLVIEGRARAAATVDRGAWPSFAGPGWSIDARALTRAERVRGEARWSRTAAFEHASVASFARVVLDLLALGAPPHLVMRTIDAMGDEIRHTAIAASIASSSAGAPRGPGALEDARAPEAPIDLVTFAMRTARDACTAETIAAIEAEAEAAVERDPVVARALRCIAADEARHAELGWATLAWAVAAGGPDVASAVLAEADALDLAVAATCASETPPRAVVSQLIAPLLRLVARGG